MAGNDAEIKIGITGDAKGLGASIKEAETTIKGFGSKVKQVMESQSASVFKGLLSYDVFKQAVGKSVEVIKESLQIANEEIREHAKVVGQLQSVGVAWEDVGDQVDAFTDKMKNLGVDDADVALANLTQALQGDLAKGFELTKMASDLASSGYGTFEEQVDSLTKIIAGKGAREMVKYGVAISDNASITEQLNAVQSRAVIKTEDWADTIEGATKRVEIAQRSIKEAIGKGMLVAFDNALKQAGVFSGALATNEEKMQAVAKASYQVANAVIAVALGLRQLGLGLGATFNAVEGTIQKGLQVAVDQVAGKIGTADTVLSKLGLTSGKTAKAIKEMSDGLGIQASESFGKIGEKADKSAENMKMFNDALKATSGEGFEEMNKKMEENELKLANLRAGTKGLTKEQLDAREASKKLGEETAKTFGEMKDKILNARDSVIELASSIKDKLAESFKEFNSSMKQDISDARKGLAEIVVGAEQDIIKLEKDLAEENAKNGEDRAQDRITQLQNEIAEKKKIITESATFETDLATKLAEKQTQIDEAKKKLEGETDPIAKAKLETEIQARETALESLKTFGGLDKQIAEERRISSLDEFSRFEEETFARIDLKTNEFISEVTQLREKQAIAEDVEAQITEFYSSQTSLRQATLDAFATSSIATLQRIGSEARSALSALQAFQSQSARANVPTGSGKAMGGFTAGGEMVHAGEYVIPRWIVQRLPSLVGQIESMRSGNGGGMTKNVNAPITINANVRDGVDIRSIGSEMNWELSKL